MPQKCTICRHPQIREITHDIMSHKPLRAIEARYDVSIAALSRHTKMHVPTALRKVTPDDMPASLAAELAEPVLVEMRKLNNRSLKILRAAKESKDYTMVKGKFRDEIGGPGNQGPHGPESLFQSMFQKCEMGFPAMFADNPKPCPKTEPRFLALNDPRIRLAELSPIPEHTQDSVPASGHRHKLPAGFQIVKKFVLGGLLHEYRRGEGGRLTTTFVFAGDKNYALLVLWVSASCCAFSHSSACFCASSLATPYRSCSLPVN